MKHPRTASGGLQGEEREKGEEGGRRRRWWPSGVRKEQRGEAAWQGRLIFLPSNYLVFSAGCQGNAAWLTRGWTDAAALGRRGEARRDEALVLDFEASYFRPIFSVRSIDFCF